MKLIKEARVSRLREPRSGSPALLRRRLRHCLLQPTSCVPSLPCVREHAAAHATLRLTRDACGGRSCAARRARRWATSKRPSRHATTMQARGWSRAQLPRSSGVPSRRGAPRRPLRLCAQRRRSTS